jgi:hypothetical protein
LGGGYGICFWYCMSHVFLTNHQFGVTAFLLLLYTNFLSVACPPVT